MFDDVFDDDNDKEVRRRIDDTQLVTYGEGRDIKEVVGQMDLF